MRMSCFTLALHLVLLLIAPQPGSAQDEYAEERYPDTRRPLYNASTKTRLHTLSENFFFNQATDEPAHAYDAVPQATAQYIMFQPSDLEAVKHDIANNMEFDTFVCKHPGAEVSRNLYVVFLPESDHPWLESPIDTFTVCRSLPLNNRISHKIQLKIQPREFSLKRKGTWIYRSWAYNGPESRYFEAFYFTSDFTTPPIPPIFARMRQYADQMLGVERIVQHPTMNGCAPVWQNPCRLDSFANWLADETKVPSSNSSADTLSRWRWGKERVSRIEHRLVHLPHFQKELNELTDYALRSGDSRAVLEFANEHFGSVRAAWELKRNRRKLEYWNYDLGFHRHYHTIAELSIRLGQWQAFLQAHMRMLNTDTFRYLRRSGDRFTYIRELEDLNIVTPVLLMGVLLQVDDRKHFHFNLNTDDIAPAIAESRYEIVLERYMYDMIVNDNLDMYNRVLAATLYNKYTGYMADPALQADARSRLAKAVNTLPEYMQSELLTFKDK